MSGTPVKAEAFKKPLTFVKGSSDNDLPLFLICSFYELPFLVAAQQNISNEPLCVDPVPNDPRNKPISGHVAIYGYLDHLLPAHNVLIDTVKGVCSEAACNEFSRTDGVKNNPQFNLAAYDELYSVLKRAYGEQIGRNYYDDSCYLFEEIGKEMDEIKKLADRAKAIYSNLVRAMSNTGE